MTRATLEHHRFNQARFEKLAQRLRDGTDDAGVVEGKLEAPYPGDIVELPEKGSDEWEHLEELGAAELAAGRCALVVLAGGMATRMGGVVKALVEALPGRTFLDLRLDRDRHDRGAIRRGASALAHDQRRDRRGDQARARGQASTGSRSRPSLSTSRSG